MEAALIAALLKPLALELFQKVILPELQKLDGQVGSPELKIVADAMLAAIEAIVPAEVAKIPDGQ